jgi:ATP-binding cassette subfamily B protein/subfamily B ATP-binding cassette protein MsbA
MMHWWRISLRYLQAQWRSIALLLLLLLVGVGFKLLAPWPLKFIVDNVLAAKALPQSVSWLYFLPGADDPNILLSWLAFGTLALFLASALFEVLRAYLQTIVSSRMSFQLGADIFAHLQKVSLSFHGASRRGDLVRRVTTDNKYVQKLIVGIYLPLLTSLVTLLVIFGVMWVLDPTLAAIAIFVVLPLAALIRVMMPIISERALLQQNLEGDVMSLAETNLSALPVVQAFDRVEIENDRFQTLSTNTIQAYMRTILAEQQFVIGTGAITAIGVASVMAVGGFHVMGDRLEIGTLLVVISYLASLYGPVETLAQLSSAFAATGAGGKRVAEVLAESEAVPDKAATMADTGPSLSGALSLEFENVSFSYDKNRMALRNIDLSIRPAETMALVGATGAGKTTMTALAMRFYDPEAGRVLLGGVDISHKPLSELRAHFGLVLQDPNLMQMTIGENIALGMPDASGAEIEAAARNAEAHGFISELPDGYDTVIGEEGATLSGGEKQRIAIARAFVRDPSVLILDEPTSALDSETESYLVRKLADLRRDRTTIIVAHRLSTIRAADRIAVLADGEIREVGTHGELLRLKGIYARFISAAAGHEFVDETGQSFSNSDRSANNET